MALELLGGLLGWQSQQRLEPLHNDNTTWNKTIDQVQQMTQKGCFKNHDLWGILAAVYRAGGDHEAVEVCGLALGLVEPAQPCNFAVDRLGLDSDKWGALTSGGGEP